VGKFFQILKKAEAAETDTLTLQDIHPLLVALQTPTAPEAEPYWTLAYMVERMHQGADLHVVAISSPAMGDGKTITAINLAGLLAQTPEAKVLLIDADMRSPSVAAYLGLRPTAKEGLVDALLKPTLSLQDVVRICPPFNLAILPAGAPQISPYEALKSLRFEELLKEARQHYDYIVVDTPPLLPMPDCRLMEKWIDAFFVVVAAHKTPRWLLAEALNIVHHDKIIDLIFNQDDGRFSDYYYSYGYYTSRSLKKQQKTSRRFRQRKTR
jgi:capsular exopolysaccharide synthesis family protein